MWKVKVKVTQWCLTLCDPMDYAVHGILQARVLEWQPFPSPRDLPNPGIEPRSPALQVDSLPVEPPGKPKNTGLGKLQSKSCKLDVCYGMCAMFYIKKEVCRFSGQIRIFPRECRGKTRDTITSYLKFKIHYHPYNLFLCVCVLSHSVISDSLKSLVL